jgi:hypothetical protein
MRTVVLAAAVLAATAIVWWLLRPDDGFAPPAPSAPAAPTEAPQDARPARGDRSEVAGERPPPDDAPVPVAPAPVEAIADAPPNVHLRVRESATKGDVAVFRWRWIGSAGRAHGEGSDGAAAILLPPGDRGELLVEADGLQSITRAVDAPLAGGPPASVEVFLTPAVQAAGITLFVHDTSAMPVTRVRVDTFDLRDWTREQPWQTAQALWARRSSAPDGRYELPDLPPGEYGIRVLAVDDDGIALPMLPYLRTFTLTGSNGYVEDVTLEPACLPVFELVDMAGRALDPANAGRVALALRLPGGPDNPRTWAVKTASGAVTSLDHLPAAGPVSPQDAVPAGTYAFEVSIDGQLRLSRFVTLRAGERQRERFVVP